RGGQLLLAGGLNGSLDSRPGVFGQVEEVAAGHGFVLAHWRWNVGRIGRCRHPPICRETADYASLIRPTIAWQDLRARSGGPGLAVDEARAGAQNLSTVLAMTGAT